LTTALDLVPRDAALKAVTLNTIGFSVARVVGPAAAGYLIAWFGAAGCFFIQGALYAASGLPVLAIVFPPRQKPQGRSALAAVMAHTASNMASMQIAAPQEMRGRVASLMMLYPAMISAGAFLAGPLSDALGVRGASALLAVASITATAALYVLSPHLREMRT